MNRINRPLAALVLGLIAAVLCQSARGSVTVLSGGDSGEGYTPTGTPVYAYEMYGGAPTGVEADPGGDTLQGITFQSFDVFSPPAGFSVSTFVSNFSYFQDSAPSIGATANDLALQHIMENGIWYSNWIYSGSGDPAVLILGNLTAGKTYQVDLFALDSDTADPQDILFTFNGGQANHFTEVVGTYYDVTENVVAVGPGQIEVDFSSPTNSASTGIPRFSAFSVELVPEPASLGLLAIGGVTLLRRRRA
jgi:hypothetical protein